MENSKITEWEAINGVHVKNNCGGKIYMSPNCCCSRCTGRKVENDGIKRCYYLECNKCGWIVGGAENVNHKLTFRLCDLKL